MKRRRAPQDEEELVQTLAELFENTKLEESEEEVDAALRELGHDPDELASRMAQVAKQALAESPLNWRNRAPALETERQKLATFQQPFAQGRAWVVAKIQELRAQAEARSLSVTFAHRNLESLSDTDLAAVLTDLEYLLSSQTDTSDDGG